MDRGYEADFVTDVPSELHCIICHLVLREPVQFTQCSHRACLKCVNRMKRHASQYNVILVCPLDREVVDSERLHRDHEAGRTVGGLKVRCGNASRGCTWMSELKNLDDHEQGCEHRVNVLAQQDQLDAILSRLKICEINSASKDKEIAWLNSVVGEMRDDLKGKEIEIKHLKSSNDSLKKQIEVLVLSHRTWDNFDISSNSNVSSRTVLEESVDEKPCINSTTNLTMDEKLTYCESAISSIKKKMDGLALEYEKKVSGVSFNEMKDQVNSIEARLDSNYDESVQHWKNMENILFMQHTLPDKKTILQWVVQDYRYRCNIGDDVYSPIFDTTVDRYRFQMFIKWTTKGRKKNIGLFMVLHRDRHELSNSTLQPFKYEITLALMKKDGGGFETFLVTHNQMVGARDSFYIAKGADKSAPYGVDMLAPADEFVINNCVFAACTIHH